MWRHVYRDFSDLSKLEQLALFEAMKQDFFPEEREDIEKKLKGIRETRFWWLGVSSLWKCFGQEER